jgi:hypothetical protein
LGEVVFKNSSYLTTFLNFFKEISKHKNDDIRCNFLFNLPAFAKMVDKNIYAGYRHTFIELAKHKSEKLRYYWIMVLEDMVEFIPEEEKLQIIKPLIDWYLESENDPLILETINGKLSSFFKLFYAAEEEVPPPKPVTGSKVSTSKVAEPQPRHLRPKRRKRRSNLSLFARTSWLGSNLFINGGF